MKRPQVIKMTQTQGGVDRKYDSYLQFTVFGNSLMPTKRKLITRTALQSVIVNAVRETGAECEALIGVFVERVVPKSRGDVNWAVKGVQYGKAEREKCAAAISVVVERLQHEYVIEDET